MTDPSPAPPNSARRLLFGWPGDIIVAGAFLTRLPFRPAAGAEFGRLAPAARAFPLIGLALGGLGGGALWAAAGTGLGHGAANMRRWRS